MNPYQQGQSGYPQQSYYPNVGFCNSAPQSFGNPLPMPGMPTAGYPQPQASPYPTSAPGYPSAAPGYPSAAPGYPSAAPCYPSAAPGYPSAVPGNQSVGGYPTGGGHPPSAGYPSSGGYPGAGGNPTKGYPSAGYPQQQQSYSQTPSGYPSAQYSMTAQSCPSQNSPMPAQQNSFHGHMATKPKPSVVPVADFNPRQDAEILRKAMKGFGTDEKSIIQVLTRRSNQQRLQIAFEFKTLYGKDLVNDLKSETSGNFENLLVALMTPLPQFYAKELRDAMVGVGTDEDVLIEVLCTLSNHEIHVIKQTYQQMYHSNLEDDIRGETSGYFKRLMTSLCTANRTEDFNVNPDLAREQARSLLQAGELRLGTDETVFISVLCANSFPQLAEVFKQYQQLTGHDIDDAIKNEFSGDIESALRAIVKVVRNRALFFAERLQKSMKGLGTNDKQLIRIMVTRSEIDLYDVAEMFQHKYGETLQSWIEDDCSGHYKKCLLALIGAY